MGSVFNTNTKCSLPSIPAIGNFDFISDCTVPETPPPIYECPDLEFDLPFAGPAGPVGPPGSPGIPGGPGIAGPCPDFDITANITQNNGVSEPSIVVTKVPKVQIVSSSSQTLACEHDINFELNLPCPDFDITANITQNNNVAEPSVIVTKKPRYVSSSSEALTCAKDVNFELNLPCPDLRVVPELTVIDPWKPTICHDSSSSSSAYVCYKNFKPTLEIQKVEQNSSSSETSECKTVFKFKLGIPITNGWCSGYGKPRLNECPDRFYYLDLDTDDVYLKVGNGDDWGIKSGFDDFGRPVDDGWAGPITNLRGRDGSNGSDGKDGEPCTPDCPRVTGVVCTGGMLVVTYATKCDAAP